MTHVGSQRHRKKNCILLVIFIVNNLESTKNIYDRIIRLSPRCVFKMAVFCSFTLCKIRSLNDVSAERAAST